LNKKKRLWSRKPRLTVVLIRCADHATPFYPQMLALTSPRIGGHSAGIVHLWSEIHGILFFILYRIMHMHRHRHTVSHIQTQTNTYIERGTQTDSTDGQRQKQTHPYRQCTETDMCAHTQTHTGGGIQRHVDRHMQMNRHTDTQSQRNIHTVMHTQALTCTQTHADRYTLTQTQTIHTETQALRDMHVDKH
jgi:hypothetical protein